MKKVAFPVFRMKRDAGRLFGLILAAACSLPLLSCVSSPGPASGGSAASSTGDAIIRCKPQMTVHSFPLLEVDGVSGKTIVADFLANTPFMYNDANGMFVLSLMPGEHVLTFALGEKKAPYNVRMTIEAGTTYMFSPNKENIRISPETPYEIEAAATYGEPKAGEPAAVLQGRISKGKIIIYKIDDAWASIRNDVRLAPGRHEILACLQLAGRYIPAPVVVSGEFEAGRQYHIEYSFGKDDKLEVFLVAE